MQHKRTANVRNEWVQMKLSFHNENDEQKQQPKENYFQKCIVNECDWVKDSDDDDDDNDDGDENDADDVLISLGPIRTSRCVPKELWIKRDIRQAEFAVDERSEVKTNLFTLNCNSCSCTFSCVCLPTSECSCTLAVDSFPSSDRNSESPTKRNIIKNKFPIKIMNNKNDMND